MVDGAPKKGNVAQQEKMGELANLPPEEKAIYDATLRPCAPPSSSIEIEAAADGRQQGRPTPTRPPTSLPATPAPPASDAHYLSRHAKAAASTKRHVHQQHGRRRRIDLPLQPGRLLLLVVGSHQRRPGGAALMTRSVLRQLGGEPDYAVDVAGRIAAGDLSVRHRAARRRRPAACCTPCKTCATAWPASSARCAAAPPPSPRRRSQIAAGNLDLSSRTEQQASSLEETAVVDGGADVDRASRTPTTRARPTSWPLSASDGGASKGGDVVAQVVEHDGLDQRLVAQDRRHHRRHRRHRLPDQYPGAERGRRSGARRRAGTRLRRRRHRGAQPGAALGRRRQGNQGADRRLGRAGRRRQQAWSTRPARRWTKSSPASSA